MHTNGTNGKLLSSWLGKPKRWIVGTRRRYTALGLVLVAAGSIVFVLLLLLALRPLLVVFGRTVARTCRGVDPERFSMAHSDPRSPVHCPAYRPQQPPPTPRYLSAQQQPTELTQQSPVLVHYVLAMEETGSTLTFLQYVSVLSALHYHQPTQIMIHHHKNLTGHWFDLLSEQLGDKLVLVCVRDVTHIFDRPVAHYAHKADVIRLEAVLEYGGLYLDSDMLMLRSMRSVVAYEAMLGEEHIGRGGGAFLLNLWDGRGKWGERLRATDGLANAVIAGVRNSSFVRDWYQRYQTFDNSDWDWHSCKLPLLMASEPQHRDDVITLNTAAFFYVNYGDLSQFFETDNVDLRGLLAIHFSHLRDKLGDDRWDRYFGSITTMQHALQVHQHNNFGRLLRGLVYGELTW